MPGPPPPASSAAAAASWASWKAERFCGGAVEEHPRQHLVLRQRRLGGEGDLRRRDPAVDGDDGGDVLGAGVARRSGSAGRGCRRAAASPRRTRCAGRGSAAGRGAGRTGRPAGRRWWCPAAGASPPSSTSRPRPRTKISVRRADPHVEADAGAGRWRSAARGVPTLARSSVSCTGGGVDVVDLLERRLGVGRRGPRPSRSRCARGRSAPESMPPPPTSGPLTASAP